MKDMTKVIWFIQPHPFNQMRGLLPKEFCWLVSLLVSFQFIHSLVWFGLEMNSSLLFVCLFVSNLQTKSPNLICSISPSSICHSKHGTFLCNKCEVGCMPSKPLRPLIGSVSFHFISNSQVSCSLLFGQSNPIQSLTLFTL